MTAARDTKRSGRLVTMRGEPVAGDGLAELVRLAEAGELRPVIDRVYDLDDVVEAHRDLDTCRKRGSVVLRLP